MNTLKVGDKVKIRSDLEVWKAYSDIRLLSWMYYENLWKIFTVKSVIGWIVKLEEDKWFSRGASMLEPIQSSTVTSRPTYQRKAERSDGVVFEKEAIWGRSLKEIQDSIKERKDSIKADEQLLRAHRSLFSKKEERWKIKSWF